MIRRATGLRCRVCGAEVGIGTPLSWRCPNASEADRHHVLAIVADGDVVDVEDHPNPFVAHRGALAWDAYAAALDMSVAERIEMVERVDALVEQVAGTGFRWTPFARADELSHALGFDRSGGVWVKDETLNVAGSHKARHLMTVLLHLLAAERAGVTSWRHAADRPPLAIASCGNAALAAATLAAAVEWPIRVFVPPWAAAGVLDRLTTLQAAIVVCPRRDDDPPGDPCVHRFRAAVAGGAVPFGVQGPENGWCLDGGRTIGWEMVAQHRAHVGLDGSTLDRVLIQVGGGAFAACVGAALESLDSSVSGRRPPRLDAVQTEGCAPLARAWNLADSDGGPGLADAATQWEALMWPWESEPHSAADGILDDETYDWLGVFAGMVATGGAPIVASEVAVLDAHRLALAHTSIDVSATGSAGLAGLLTIREQIGSSENVAVVFSGVNR